MNQLRFDEGLGVYSNQLSFNRLTKVAQDKEESETSSASTGFHAPGPCYVRIVSGHILRCVLFPVCPQTAGLSIRPPAEAREGVNILVTVPLPVRKVSGRDGPRPWAPSARLPGLRG